MTAIHCRKAMLDKRRFITSRVRTTIYTHPLHLWNAFEWELGLERGSKETCSNEDTSKMLSNQDLSEMCSNEDASERRSNQGATETYSNENLHTFELEREWKAFKWGPSRVSKRTFMRSNEDPNTLERGHSNKSWTCLFCMQNAFALCLVSGGYCTKWKFSHEF